MAGQPIPPYDEADERAAREALGLFVNEGLVREVAGAIATARAEGRREVLDRPLDQYGTTVGERLGYAS